MELTIAAKWQEYNEKIIPETASTVQRKETEQAFYGGAIAILSIIFTLAADEISEDDGADALQRLAQESRDWVKKKFASHVH